MELNRLQREMHRREIARDWAIVQLLVQTGLRVGKLAALTLGDLKLGERSGQVTVRRGKGDGYREVPVNADARQALREYLAERPDTGTEALWVSQRGRGLTANAIWRVVTTYAQFARVTVSPHGLRHTFCTRLLREQGADLVAVATLAGHSVATTARYTRPSRATLAELTEALGRGDGG